jgi:hypothetical protein
MGEWNFIGDVHGDMSALKKLTAKMPKAPFFSVGDMIDRGLHSKEVIEFFMQEGNKALLGNHEHFLLDFYFNRKLYQKGIWLYKGNGGQATVYSFDNNIEAKFMKDNDIPMYLQQWDLSYAERLHDHLYEKRGEIFEDNIISWLDNLPIYYEDEELFVSHAPRSAASWEYLMESKNHSAYKCKDNLLWNINHPKKIEGKFFIHGHLRTERPKKYSTFGAGIDTWRGKDSILTGFHWPSKKMYTVKV